mgnify:CR=1 FL=1
MPNQAVTNDSHLIALTKTDKFICLRKIILIFFRMNDRRLHAVFRHDGIKILLYNFNSCDILNGTLHSAPQLAHTASCITREALIAAFFAALHSLHLTGSFSKPFSANFHLSQKLLHKKKKTSLSIITELFV